MTQNFPCGCRMAEVGNDIICDDCRGLEDGIYQGNRNAWIDRCYSAENRLEDLITGLQGLKVYFGLAGDFDELSYLESDKVMKLVRIAQGKRG